MHPRLRTILATIAACCLAIFLGSEIAQGNYLWPALAGMVCGAAIMIRFTGLPADTIVLGLVLIGYMVGNRGFAQLTPTSGVPLLPAEVAILAGCSWRLIHCALRRTVPFRADALNWAVLALLTLGTVRVAFDVSRHGFNALRDYATIYYCVFFFLAQTMAENAASRRYLVGCLLTGIVLLGPVFGLFQLFERFFLTHLVVAGTPLIYYKGDLVATHLAAGSLVLFHWARGRQRSWAWPLSGAIVVFLLAYDSRAALLGSLLASGLLLAARRRAYPAMQGAIVVAGVLAIGVAAAVFDNDWAGRKLETLVDRAGSFVDVSGRHRYQSEDSYYKGDNNRFRLVWWRNVVEETSQSNPVFGLGFGADLARGFVQEYYPDQQEEFNTRSPHNIFVTVYGRMGAVGLAAWLWFCAVLLFRTWRSLRHDREPVTWSLWCGAWVVLVSATFGVVLEGPMGAVIFWSLLGLANTSPGEKEPPDVTQAPAGLAEPAADPAVTA